MLGIFSCQSICQKTRYLLVKQSQTFFIFNQSKKQKYYELKQTLPNLNFQSANNEHFEIFSQTLVVGMRDKTTVDYLLTCVCQRCHLNPSSHFIRIKQQDTKLYRIPEKSDLITLKVRSSHLMFVLTTFLIGKFIVDFSGICVCSCNFLSFLFEASCVYKCTTLLQQYNV